MRIIDDAAVGPYERVVHAVDEASGLRAIVAVHSTALGPAVGGTRFYPYGEQASAVIDVLRLAEGMTLKAAAAGLRLGGGKAVIAGDPARLAGRSLWRAYARVIELFEGSFYTAQDVGTTQADMLQLASSTRHVLGLHAAGEPSPFTARGVLAAMRAAWESDSGAQTLAGARVVVQGVGKVGTEVARRLVAEGARVWLSDTAGDRAAALAARIGARTLAPAGAHTHPCDIFSPCAMGGVINEATVPALTCRWVVGAANNQLSSDAVANRLAARGIGYVPDFIANAGGLICVSEELNGWDAVRVGEAVDRIGQVVHELVESARDEGDTLLAVARRRAAERIAVASVR